jgi:hypothetical protein
VPQLGQLLIGARGRVAGHHHHYHHHHRRRNESSWLWLNVRVGRVVFHGQCCARRVGPDGGFAIWKERLTKEIADRIGLRVSGNFVFV